MILVALGEEDIDETLEAMYSEDGEEIEWEEETAQAIAGEFKEGLKKILSRESYPAPHEGLPDVWGGSSPRDGAASGYTSEQLDRIKGLGKEWQKGGHHRVYFDNGSYFYGVRTERYGSGNISSATLDGKKISNSEAKRILSKFAYSKLWFDLNDQKFRTSGELSSEMFKKTISRIKVEVRGELGEEIGEAAGKRKDTLCICPKCEVRVRTEGSVVCGKEECPECGDKMQDPKSLV